MIIDDKHLVNDPSKFPVGRHYAILLFKKWSFHHEGDERSRTHPGHGYPAYTESGIETEYYFFLDQSEWESAVSILHQFPLPSDYTAFRAFIVEGTAKIKATVNVDIETVKS